MKPAANQSRCVTINNASSHNRFGRRALLRGRLGLLLTAILVCTLCGWLGAQATHPFALAGQWRDENDRIERQMLRYRLENQRQEKELKALETPEGIEREARKYGFVRPQEQKLRIPGN